jgi:hypothetical protein
MPTKRFYGGVLGDNAVGDRQVPQMPASKTAAAPLQADRWARNGLHPDAALINGMNEACNAAVLFRSRQIFCSYARINAALGTVSSADRDRWRFAFHTGPYCHALFAIVSMIPTDGGPTLASQPTSNKLIVYSDTAEAVTVVTQTFTYGSHPHGGTGSDTVTDIRVAMNFIEGVSPDTDYYAKFVDVNYGRIQSATVFELQSLTEESDGYASQNNTAMSPIVSAYRQTLAPRIRNLWRRGSAQVLNWTADDPTGGIHAPPSIISATATNIIDGTSTTVSASTPGYTLVMNNKDRLSQSSGIPCVMKAYGKMSAGSTAGVLQLKDSTGAVIASIGSGAFTSVAGWHSSAAFNLPATTAKYDIHFKSDGAATFTLYAVSIYQYET